MALGFQIHPKSMRSRHLKLMGCEKFYHDIKWSLGRLEGEAAAQFEDFACFGSTLGSILVPKSFQNPSEVEPKPSKMEFGKAFRLRARPGGELGVSRGELGASRDSFWDDLGWQNAFQIHEKSSWKNEAFWEAFFPSFQVILVLIWEVKSINLETVLSNTEI